MIRSYVSRFQAWLKAPAHDPVKIPARAKWDIGPSGASLIARQKAAAAKLGPDSIKPISREPARDEFYPIG